MGEEISSFSSRSSNREASNTPVTFHTQSLHASEGLDSQISLTETNKKTLSSSEQILLNQLRESLAKNPTNTNTNTKKHSAHLTISQ